MLIYSWIIHWVIIQWAVLKINKKYPFRNARFAPLSMRREFGAFLIALVVVAYTMTREALRPEVINKELPRNPNGILKGCRSIFILDNYLTSGSFVL